MPVSMPCIPEPPLSQTRPKSIPNTRPNTNRRGQVVNNAKRNPVRVETHPEMHKNHPSTKEKNSMDV
ncbi:hypothetical protein DL98DRAFT_510735 [Cadophora sp. DSE1049]|nr:hypothetical protein DL98DRAFT_510735 [Cadophora sp. DSE1049]